MAMAWAAQLYYGWRNRKLRGLVFAMRSEANRNAGFCPTFVRAPMAIDGKGPRKKTPAASIYIPQGLGVRLVAISS
jgi:hypothetical protein